MTNTAYRDINAVQMFGISRPEAFDWETERAVIEAQRLEEADPDIHNDIDGSLIEETPSASSPLRSTPSPPMSPSQMIARERSVRAARDARQSSLQEHPNPLCEPESSRCLHVADDDVSEEEKQLLAKLDSLRGSNKKRKARKKSASVAKDDPTQMLEQIRSIDDGAVMSMTSNKPFLAVTEIMKNVK